MEVLITLDGKLIVNCENSVDEYAMASWLPENGCLDLSVSRSTQRNRLCLVIEHREKPAED